jgi:hypothetical protein
MVLLLKFAYSWFPPRVISDSAMPLRAALVGWRQRQIGKTTKSL